MIQSRHLLGKKKLKTYFHKTMKTKKYELWLISIFDISGDIDQCNVSEMQKPGNADLLKVILSWKFISCLLNALKEHATAVPSYFGVTMIFQTNLFRSSFSNPQKAS